MHRLDGSSWKRRRQAECLIHDERRLRLVVAHVDVGLVDAQRAFFCRNASAAFVCVTLHGESCVETDCGEKEHAGGVRENFKYRKRDTLAEEGLVCPCSL